MGYITNKEELVRAVMKEYARYSTEMSEEYFTGISVDMTKADFIEAYAEIQMEANGDEVVRLDGNMQKMDELYPDAWRRTKIAGDAKQILLDINNEGLSGEGPLLARICFDDKSLLDLVWGRFDI